MFYLTCNILQLTANTVQAEVGTRIKQHDETSLQTSVCTFCCESSGFSFETQLRRGAWKL